MSDETPPTQPPPSKPTPTPEPTSEPTPTHEPTSEPINPPTSTTPEPAPTPEPTSEPTNPPISTATEPVSTPEPTSEPIIPPSEPAQITASSEKPPETERKFIQSAVSFKVESNLLVDLTEYQRRSLDELKKLAGESLAGEQPPPSIWGVPLFADDRTDVILLKFLRAREFRAIEAHSMLRKTLAWRKEFKIEDLVETKMSEELEKVVFMHGHDREGHPVCYNVYGEFRDKELYATTFSTEERRQGFLRWRIRFLERSIRGLDFGGGGVNTIFQVNDLKNAPGPGKRELRLATRDALSLLQDNYPEFVAKQVFINVPWWYVVFYTMMSPFMTQRTKSKFVFAGPSKTAETLFKYISPEQVPIQYGGLSVDYCDCNPEFTVDDTATVINLKPTTKQFVEIICSETCVIVWELRVVGWEVTYSAEFVPNSQDGYTVIIQKATKMASNDDPVISGSFKVGDLGKIVLTVDNPTFKKKKLIYRYKVLPYSV